MAAHKIVRVRIIMEKVRKNTIQSILLVLTVHCPTTDENPASMAADPHPRMC